MKHMTPDEINEAMNAIAAYCDAVVHNNDPSIAASEARQPLMEAAEDAILKFVDCCVIATLDDREWAADRMEMMTALCEDPARGALTIEMLMNMLFIARRATNN